MSDPCANTLLLFSFLFWYCTTLCLLANERTPYPVQTGCAS